MTAVRRLVTVSWRGRRIDVELIAIDDKGHELELGAAAAWHRMVEAAASDGAPLRAKTAFRSLAFQTELRAQFDDFMKYKRAVDLWANSGRVGPEPTRVPYAALAAKPGNSAHEIGVAVDIDRRLDKPELTKKIDDWLARHAEKHGWIRTVKSEPWHWEWRYGLSVASP